ncbi:uncharacterized protein Dana_GF18016 [Drosophila ananassae]|uniref:ODAD1 central coiled coil region domain-containing protein n=1 Tax=Drosophila ananassae TaxID=7217 RepID=B3LV23_DROAN|nr:outer dynein arm protein 1 [Drosophila ananassae]EDV42495.1 uncharacterized protein Dana_GF18016 [Drosophila ananassae]
MDDDIQKFPKHDFLESYMVRTKELAKRQREYRNLLFGKLKTRKEQIVEASYKHSINQLDEEKNELRAQIWVASGKPYKEQNQRFLNLIRCHVECQENLADDISALKTSITNMELQIGRMNKQLYSLNLQTVPDERHIAEVQHKRKRMNILENNLEVGFRMEGAFTAHNASLREQLIFILNTRSFFNDSYTKMVKRLDNERKYLIDLIEYAVSTYDNCIEVFEKNELLAKRDRREGDLRKVEMQGLVRRIAANTENAAFFECKAKPRVLADLQPKEYRRREKFRSEHRKKVNLYDSVLKKIKAFTASRNVAEVIEKFNEQESLYYSYFNYNNEMSYHVTLLNNSVNHLFRDIISLRNENVNTLQWQIEEIARLEGLVAAKQESNTTLVELRDNNEALLESLLQGVETICKICNLDKSPFKPLLGDHNHVKLVNLQRFLKALETRVYDVLACVYAQERHDKDVKQFDYVVSNAEKTCEAMTHLDDIVLTQQCPECAETDAQNIEEGGDLSYPHSVKDSKKKLYEKITQPEIQYRLHSISQCRLPRSRLLAARRNM